MQSRGAAVLEIEIRRDRWNRYDKIHGYHPAEILRELVAAVAVDTVYRGGALFVQADEATVKIIQREKAALDVSGDVSGDAAKDQDAEAA